MMKNKLLYLIIASLGLAYFTSCKKSEYLTDGGLSEAKTPLTTYDYLKQHKYHLFDTLIMVIDHYNMKEEEMVRLPSLPRPIIPSTITSDLSGILFGRLTKIIPTP